MTCDNCGEKTPFNFKSLMGEATLCSECKEGEANPLKWDDLEIEGPVEDVPPEIREQILEQLHECGVTDASEVGMKVEKIALDGDNPGEFSKKMHLLKAREGFAMTSQAFMAVIHAIKHAGVGEHELEVIVKRFSALQYEIIADYLFYGEDKLKTQDEIYTLNIDNALKCDHKETDNDNRD